MKQDDRGIAVIEIILILVILIALVIIFGDEISNIVQNVLKKISGNATKITNSNWVTPIP